MDSPLLKALHINLEIHPTVRKEHQLTEFNGKNFLSSTTILNEMQTSSETRLIFYYHYQSHPNVSPLLLE